MSFSALNCPACGAEVTRYTNPFPTVDIIIEIRYGIILIERKNPPYGWALPGGFVDYGESVETAARREALEETSIVISNLRLVGCYSDPARDDRMHTISTVFAAEGSGNPLAADDAASLQVFSLENMPNNLCFDHEKIIVDYIRMKQKGLL
ncbi:NUDIX domain-containing protein [Pelotalea chapellei]|uniref:NUDIX hydrolase n=1 Tax=Pelotalea chapellei TaxID=44671 RepID=A0ABS5U7Q4_9BACT|nr:NUDIX hydrolase [Pelotalea chapellei]MBT1071694.1 NUDIX hydrolase [Pelotalea chapellei]